MMWNLSDYYILMRTKNQDPTTFKFPYCVFFHSIALFGNVSVFILFVVNVLNEQRRQKS